MKEAVSVAIVKRAFRNIGGIKNKIVEEIKACNSFGCTPFVLVENEEERLDGVDYTVVRFGIPFRHSFFSRFFGCRVARWLRLHRPDLVISHNDVPSDDMVHVHNCVHLHHERVYGVPLPKDNRHGKAHTAIYRNRKCALFIANSRMTKDDLVARHGVPPERIRVVYPEFDLERFNPRDHEEKRRQGRALLGLAAGDEAVGLVTSGDFAKRNAGFFIDVVARLAEARPNLKAVLVGKDKFGPYAEQIARHKLEGRLLLHSAVADVEKIYHALDLTILPAFHEEFGYVVVESLACGTPALVSDRVGAAELYAQTALEDMVLPLGDAGLWAESAAALLDDSTKRQRLADAGKELARRYTGESEALYRSILQDALAAKIREKRQPQAFA